MNCNRMLKTAIAGALVFTLFTIRLASADWQVATVDSSTSDVGQWSALALDSKNNPRISYYDSTNGGLTYARLVGSIWLKEIVDSTEDAGLATSLALDKDNNPHISYVAITNDEYTLKYAHYTGSIWQIETLDSGGGVGKATSLALDSSGNPHISYYYEYPDDGMGWLNYIRYDGSKWLPPQTVDGITGNADVGNYCSLAFDSVNKPHISYYDYTNGDLKYTRWDGSKWQIETVDGTGDVGAYTSLALDKDNNPHISYYDSPNGYLKYARYTGSIWQIERVDSTEDDVGGYTSLALDSNSQPNISYSDFVNGDLKYARYNGSVWQINIVDSAGDAGYYSYTSLALDSTNKAYMSYYYETGEINGDLKYANGTIRTNTTTTADGGGGGGGGGGSSTTTTVSSDTSTTSTSPTTTTTTASPSLCTSAADCDDGLFCNGPERCANGTCVPGISPCDTGKQCREDQDQCWDIFELSATSLQKSVRRPIVRATRCPWLLVNCPEDNHYSAVRSTITIEGSQENWQGVEVDGGRNSFKVGNIIFVPICIGKGAAAGQWQVKIKTANGNIENPFEETIEALFQVQ